MDAKSIGRFLAPLHRRVMLMVARSVVELVDDATKMQLVQVSLLEGEVRDKVERFQNFGFTSVPEPGAEAVAASVAGNRDHVVVIVCDDRRYRKKGLLPGESCVYDKWGNFILLKQGEIIIQHATKITLVAPTVAVEGNLTVSGSVVAQGTVIGAGKNLETHVHTNGNGGANTGAPV